jgi:hypothetical protein
MQIKACANYDKEICDPEKHQQLIQDVFFFKILKWDDEVGGRMIHPHTTPFTKSNPLVRWRLKSSLERHAQECRLHQSNDIVLYGTTVLAHLYASFPRPGFPGRVSQAGLATTALQEHERTKMGHFVNYNQLPNITWWKIP